MHMTVIQGALTEPPCPLNTGLSYAQDVFELNTEPSFSFWREQVASLSSRTQTRIELMFFAKIIEEVLILFFSVHYSKFHRYSKNTTQAVSDAAFLLSTLKLEMGPSSGLDPDLVSRLALA